jgi:LmbE family N-acetylglucosaminyl deacetylase
MFSLNKSLAIGLLFAWLPAGIAHLEAQPAPAGEIQQALLKLNELGTVLTIAAHPDDERSELLAYFSQGRHMRAAYLSVTRGEGGQNLLGPEQSAALGLIRTQELLDARRIDGAEQFFTRAIDFGFSKTADEAIAKWGHAAVLSDMVWVIRRYRPDVIVLGFSGTPADGHGHHQASALLGKEAYEAAGDPARFPEQLRYVQPWKAAKLVRAGGFFGGVAGGRGGRGGTAPEAAVPPIAPIAQIDTSGYNSILGYSYAQLATISRSQHRSQGLGAMGVGGGMGGGRGPGGPAPSGAAPAPEAPAAPAPDLFDGIEHSWKRLPGGAAIDAIFSQAIREFDWQHPDRTIPLLAKARPLVAAISDPLAKIKLAELDETIARCAGIWADAQAREGNVAPGSHVAVAMTVVAREPVATSVQSIAAENVWTGKPWTAPDAAAGQRIPDYDLEVPASQPYSQPYWLVKPPEAGAYTVDNQLLIGLPDTPVERMRIRLTVAGTPIELVRPVLYRYNDRLEGEKVRPLTVVPPVAVNLPLSPDDITNQVLLFPRHAARGLRVTVKAEVANAAGSLRLDVPAGWKAEPSSQPFRLAAIDDQQELTFQVTPPAGETAGTLHAVATVGGKEIAAGMAFISYAHIPQQNVFPPSDVKLIRSDIAVTARRVGYIMGAGDEEPDALRQLGLEVTLLGDEDLRAGDLSRFDAIVAGVRAYNVRPDLRAYQSRLLDYVSNGGTYVVQNVRENVPNIGPYPFTISTGNSARVTVEEAPVTFTHPDSALLQKPNKIGPRDFEGWVQERGTYFLTQWDPRYETVLSTNDPGEKPLEGGELWTRYGKGIFIYTAYVWFRELPAGVPGAYRLFANLLSAK